MLGLETEHALVSSEGSAELGEELLAEAISGTASARSEPKDGYFLANGSLIHLEVASRARRDLLPLLETATAECSTPLELVTHARAAALRVGRAAARLRESGRDLSVFRASNDLLGRTWGAHENYQVREDHGVGARALWMFVISVFFVVVLLATGVLYAVRLLGLVLPRRPRRRAGLWHDRFAEIALDLLAYPVVQLLVDPVARLVAYRRVRPPLEAHLATRTLYSGAGGLSLAPGEPLLFLSPRALATGRMFGVYQFGRRKPAIDPKPYLTSPGSVLRRSQRVQVGTGDSNRMHVAEWLKVGTTWLVIEAADRGGHLRPVQLRDPLRALHDVARGGPTTQVQLSDGRFVRALDHQWLVLRAVRAALGAAASTGEAAQLIGRWASVLRRLGTDDEAGLARELDIHAKRRVLRELAREQGWSLDDLRRRCAAYGPLVRAAVRRRLTDLSEEALLAAVGAFQRWRLRVRLRREGLPREACPDDLAVVLAAVKIDVRYHELGRGYHEMLAAAGEAEELVPFERLRAALDRPPNVYRARERGRRVVAASGRKSLRVGWRATYGGGEAGDPLPPLD